jgi:hypothetical protein
MSRRRLGRTVFGAIVAAIVTLVACAVDSWHGDRVFVQYLFYPVTFFGALLAWFYEGDNSPTQLHYLGCTLSLVINILLGSAIAFLIAGHRSNR